MNLKSLLMMAGLAVSAIGISACDNSSDDVPIVQPTPPPPVVFSDFVKQQFADTADDTDPVEVDDTDFAFIDEGNPDAFDDILSSNP